MTTSRGRYEDRGIDDCRNDITLAEVSKLFAQLCSAVCYLHENGCVHGKISARQVWIASGTAVRAMVVVVMHRNWRMVLSNMVRMV